MSMQLGVSVRGFQKNVFSFSSRQKVLEAQRVFEELTSESSTSDVKEFTRLTGACGGGGANASFRGLALFADGASR